jgi:hypothetical protein
MRARFVSLSKKLQVRNKYHAKRCIYKGIKFSSQGEMRCYQYLELLEKAGYLRDIETHITTKLIAGISHKTDFRMWDIKAEQLVYAEFKGMVTDRWRIIKKLWKIFGPAELRVFIQKNGKIILEDVICPSAIPTVLLPPACIHCDAIQKAAPTGH